MTIDIYQNGQQVTGIIKSSCKRRGHLFILDTDNTRTVACAETPQRIEISDHLGMSWALATHTWACPESLTLQQGATLQSSCEVSQAEVASLVSQRVLALCETVCADAYRPAGTDRIQVLVTNQMTSAIQLEIGLTLSNLAPQSPSPVNITIPAGKSYILYQGTLTNTSSWQTTPLYSFAPDMTGANHRDDVIYDLPWAHNESRYVLSSDGAHFEFALPLLSSVAAARGGTVIGIKDNEDERDFTTISNHSSNNVYIRHDDKTVGVYENLVQNGAKSRSDKPLFKGSDRTLRSDRCFAESETFFYVLESATGSLAQKGRYPVPEQKRGVFSSLQTMASYTATHESNTTTPDLSFEDDNDPELDASGNATVTPILSSLSVTQIQQVYISYYGRPGDPAGVIYWAGKLEDNDGNLSAIIDAFGNSPEYRQRFGSLSTSSLVNNLYQQMFGQDAESAGLDWWSKEITSGRTTLSQAAINFAAGAQNNDLVTLNKRTEMAERITQQIDAGGILYGSEDIDYLKAFIQTVTHTTNVQAADLKCNTGRNFE